LVKLRHTKIVPIFGPPCSSLQLAQVVIEAAEAASWRFWPLL